MKVKMLTYWKTLAFTLNFILNSCSEGAVQKCLFNIYYTSLEQSVLYGNQMEHMLGPFISKHMSGQDQLKGLRYLYGRASWFDMMLNFVLFVTNFIFIKNQRNVLKSEKMSKKKKFEGDRAKLRPKIDLLKQSAPPPPPPPEKVNK